VQALPHIIDALVVVAATVAIHSGGTLGILWCLQRYQSTAERHFGYMQNTAALTCLVILLLCLHAAEVGCWAAVYDASHCFPDYATAVYFSLETYSTVGYGDVVLNKEWRVLGGLEALTGMLMVSWSTVLLLGACGWIYSRRVTAWHGKWHLKERAEKIK
jgi:hypothetical protein